MTPQAPVFYPSDETKSYTFWLVYKLGRKVCRPVKKLVCVITRVGITVRRFKSDMLPNINGSYIRTPTMRTAAPRRAGRMGWERRSLRSFSRVRFDRVIKFKLWVNRVCWICSGLGKWRRGTGPLSPAGLVCGSSVITLPRGTSSQPMGMHIAGFRQPFLVAADDH